MHVDEIEALYFRAQGPPHRRRPIEAPEDAAWKIGHLHPFDVDRATERNCAVARSIDIGRKDMDIVAQDRQFAAERVHRPDGAPISYCGQICWDDMEKAQKLVPRLKFVQFQ